MARPRLTERDSIVVAFIKDNPTMSDADVARHFHDKYRMSERTVANVRRAAGITLWSLRGVEPQRIRFERKRALATAKREMRIAEIMAYKEANPKASLREIGKHLGISGEGVRRYLQRNVTQGESVRTYMKRHLTEASPE